MLMLRENEDDDDWDHLHELDPIESSSSWTEPINLLAQQGPLLNQHDGGQKISDAITYGPRFCQLFQDYSSTLPVPVNTDRHLMSLYLEHLVPFCNWARQNDAQIASIRTTLLENEYLRPEVRNGIAVVLVYTFSAVKALQRPNLDMFQTLQDGEFGLAIVNKISMKIYNDPFTYLAFLKTCISSLIDAGTIPDNERVNQAKRGKTVVENREEIEAFGQIMNILVGLLDARNNAGAQQLVMYISLHWQQRAKVRRRNDRTIDCPLTCNRTPWC